MPSPPSPRLIEAITHAPSGTQVRLATGPHLPAAIVLHRLRSPARDWTGSPLGHDRLPVFAPEDSAEPRAPSRGRRRLSALRHPVSDRLRSRHQVGRQSQPEESFDLRGCRHGHGTRRHDRSSPPISLTDGFEAKAAPQAEFWDDPARPGDPAICGAMCELRPNLAEHGRWLRDTHNPWNTRLGRPA